MESKLVLLCLFLCVSDYLVANSHELPDLTETTAEALPFHAVVRAKMVCNGILITDRHVITPAYCVYGSRSATVHLGFRGYPHYMVQHPEPNTQIIPSSKITLHEDFTKLNNQHYLNNIAVIQLSKPATLSDKVRPGKLVARQEYHLLEGKFAEVSGWIVGKDEGKKIAKVQIRNQDTCSYLFGDGLLKSQELCVKWFTKTRLNLVGNPVRIDDKIIGFQTNTPQCSMATSSCSQNDMVLNFIPFLDWMSHNMDVPIEQFTSKDHECSDNHDLIKLEDFVRKINETLYKELINFKQYDGDIGDLNKKIENILAELKNTKQLQNNFALSLNEQISAIATQINNNKIQIEQNIFKLQEELNSMKTEVTSGLTAQQTFNDLEAKFIGLNDTVELKVNEQSDKFKDQIQELTKKVNNNDKKLIKQKDEIINLYIQLSNITTELEESQHAIDEKFSHVNITIETIFSEQHQANNELKQNEAKFQMHVSHEKEEFAKLQKELEEDVIDRKIEVNIRFDKIERLFGDQRHDMDKHVIKEFEQLHDIKTKLTSMNVTLNRIAGIIFDNPPSN